MKKENVENVVKQFVQGANQRLVEQVDSVLDDNFRAVVNRAFGNDRLMLISKPVYLDMLSEGKLGGDNRTIEFLWTDITGNNALVKARLTGKATVFTTYISLVRNKENQWLIVSDQPHIEQVSDD
ncbi:nuclear transport factor 2 family protein [Fulvivirga kasyanovii]|nr:nuclear transport factor 2 family protein [Fulvivirga kasyanovii]